jgi:hypothetical protein
MKGKIREEKLKSKLLVADFILLLASKEEH